MISNFKKRILDEFENSTLINGSIALGVDLKIPSLDDFELNESFFDIFENHDFDLKFMDTEWKEELSKTYIKGLSLSDFSFREIEGVNKDPIVININSNKSSKDSLDCERHLGEIVFVDCKENSSAEIVIVKDGSSLFSQDILRFLIRKGSNIKVTFLQNMDDGSNSFSYHGFKVYENSTFNLKELILGSKFNYSKVKVFQYGNCKSDVSSLIFSQDDSQKLMDVETDQFEDCNDSKISIKGMTYLSKTIASSKINISEDAKDGSAFESIEVLNLSEYSQSSLMPLLEIHNPNVSCSHKATIELLDEDKLFYLQSRGLGLDEAKSLVISSFLKSEVSKLPLIIKKDVFNILKTSGLKEEDF